MQTAPAAKKSPSPLLVVLVSMLGYPGAGHLFLGKKWLGCGLALLFTLATVGVLRELWPLVPEMMKLARMAAGNAEAFTIPVFPDLQRTGIWSSLSGLVWVGAGVHSGWLASRARG